MIAGVVNSTLVATVHLFVRCPHGQEEDVEAIINTDFNGHYSASMSVFEQHMQSNHGSL